MKTPSVFASCPSPPPPPPTTSCCLCSMPVLKETYLQIQERNRREIRNRTKARVDQLAAEEIRNRTEAKEEQFAGGEESVLATPSPLSCSSPAPLHHAPQAFDLSSPVPLHHAPQAPDCQFVVIVLLLLSILLSQILHLFLK